jgi:hypothetical protein
MIGISIFALIFYVAGLPAVTLVTTAYARKKDLLRDPATLKTVGLFYREYGARQFDLNLAYFYAGLPRSAMAFPLVASTYPPRVVLLQCLSTTGGTLHSFSDA